MKPAPVLNMDPGFLWLMALAIGLIVLSTSQFVAVGIASGRAGAEVRSRRAADLQGLRQAAQIARLNSELQVSARNSSLPWRVMEVAEIIEESLDCRSFYLIDPYRQPLPDFLPGQHLMVRPALAGAYQSTRCYSLSSAPDNRYWRITVKRQPLKDSAASSGVQRTGGLSDWLHRCIGVGDCLLIGGPSGGFYLPPDNTRPLVLLAAGVGITPLASMLNWSMAVTPKRPVHLLYQAQDSNHWPLGRSLHQQSQAPAACRVTSYFSRANDEGLAALIETQPQRKQRILQPGLPEFMLGKFDAQDALRALPGEDCDYFLCGPNAWMDRLQAELLAAGVSAHRVHRESFGASPSNTPTLKTAGAEQALAVRFEASGIQVPIDSDQSLWELARQHQVDIPSGCLSGVCGCCRIKLLAGRITYDREPSIAVMDGECLACIARPLTDCCVDA